MGQRLHFITNLDVSPSQHFLQFLLHLFKGRSLRCVLFLQTLWKITLNVVRATIPCCDYTVWGPTPKEWTRTRQPFPSRATTGSFNTITSRFHIPTIWEKRKPLPLVFFFPQLLPTISSIFQRHKSLLLVVHQRLLLHPLTKTTSKIPSPSQK